MILRDYQIKLSTQWVDILRKYKLLYLWMQVRVWKTITALETAKKYGSKNVIFITKLKAIKSIQDDYIHYIQDFKLTVINYESLHKIKENNFDLVILDEVHSKLSWFPKPSETFKIVKQKFSKTPAILLSGTPLIESASKIYPQLIFSIYSPYIQYKNFYSWFKDYGIPNVIYTSYWQATDYSNCKYDRIIEDTKHLFLTYTQKEAWFKTEIQEKVLFVKMKDETYSMIEKLKQDKVIEWKSDTILADTWVKLQICITQMYSWTIKLESGKAITIDNTKAKFIKKYFEWKKIAIFYIFIQEKELLKQVFWELVTDDLEEFKTTKKSYIWQIVANREWISLKEADVLVFYNMPFSGTSWVQWKDRLSYLWREKNEVYVICAEWWIEEKILKVVRKKQNFTNKIFQKCLSQ